MKKIEVSDEAYAALQRLAAAKNVTPAELVAALVDPEGWQQLVAGAEKSFREILAREATLQKP